MSPPLIEPIPTAGRRELTPIYFDTDQIVTPDDNPPLNPAVVRLLVESLRENPQFVPGYVCPSSDLPEGKRLVIEGNHRLAACRFLKQQFWAFDMGRYVEEKERIELLFQHNHSRRVMSREETAEKAARWMELTGKPAFEAAKCLNISGATLSRAFNEKRIPPELREQAELLSLSTRSVVAATPPAHMGRALEFALEPGDDGKKPTRDQVSAFVHQLKKSGEPKAPKPRAITLKHNRRAITFAVTDQDSASSLAEDLKSVIAKLGKHAEVPLDGLPFLFQ